MSTHLLRLTLPILLTGFGIFRLFIYFTQPMTPVRDLWWGIILTVVGAFQFFFRYSKLKKEGYL